MFRNYKGITLVSLVITIIVMLILAGVSLSMVTGDSSVLQQADRAVKESEIAAELEEITLAVNGYRIKEYSGASVQELADELEDKSWCQGAVYDKEEGATLVVSSKNTGQKYYISDNKVYLAENFEAAPKIDPTGMYAALYTDGVLRFYATEENIPEDFNVATIVRKTGDISNVNGLDETTRNENYFWTINDDTTYSSQIKIISFEEIIAPMNTSYIFRNLNQVTEIQNITNLNTSNVTNMQGMFYRCQSLQQLPIRTFNTSNVTDMSFMFYDCNQLYKLDLSNFDTSKVTTMRAMFYGASGMEILDVRHFDTSNVTNLAWTFGAGDNVDQNQKLKKIIGLENWDVSKVTDMQRLFRHQRKLESLDLSSWNTSNVEIMMQVFNCCYSLRDLNIDGWDMSKATDMSNFMNSNKNINSEITITTNRIPATWTNFLYQTNSESGQLVLNYTAGSEAFVDALVATNNKVKKGVLKP